MLTHLVVKDVALVDHLALDFDAGMSVITGETGAGKSIMLDALGLALGDRAESGLIATGADKAEINATFDVTGNTQAATWLTERELSTESSECLLRRIVARDGRSRGFINGVPATVNDLRTLGEMLIDIHSQHEHQSLLKKDTHRRLLDEFGGLSDLAREVAAVSHEFAELQRELDELLANNQEQSARIQLLAYQAEELDALGATATEAESLESEQKLLADAEHILSACNVALAALIDDDSGNALALVSRAIQQLSRLQLAPTQSIIDLLESSRIQLDEAIHDLRRFGDNVELNPDRLAAVEARLSALYDVARKHRVEPAGIPALAERIRAELDRLGNADEEVALRETQISLLRTRYGQLAGKLTSGRNRAQAKLRSLVSEQLATLGMQGARFDIALSSQATGQPHPHGDEDVEFLISTNPGQAPRALRNVASGGELSRISLAIQVVTADTSRVPTLIFDEVDVGIGGAVAEVVGAMLRKLGTRAQIICVTHLPQVASQGNHHYRVTKTSDRKGAKTNIVALPEADKIEEIARMLGGLEVTSQSRAHAEEMWTSGQKRG